MPVAELDFESLVSPVSLETFLAEYWEQSSLLIQRAEPDFYSSLLAASDLDYIVSMVCSIARRHPSPQKPLVELIGGGAEPSPYAAGEAPEAVSVYQMYERGSTIRISSVQNYWKPIWQLCRAMEQTFSFPVNINLYITPPESKGLDRHYDEHDVLVLQICGRKHWRSYGSAVSLPLENPPIFHFEKWNEVRDSRLAKEQDKADPNATISVETILSAGDLLYLPRGHYHEAWTSDDRSAHLTVGIQPITWLDLVSAALGQAAERDVRFRRSLPVGFINRNRAGADMGDHLGLLLKAISDQSDIKSLMEETAERFIRSRQVIGEGALSGSPLPDRLDLNTPVEVRPGLICSVVADGDRVGLAFYNKVMYVPKFVGPALRFISETGRFRVREIAGGLSDASKLVLVRSLLAEAFLRVSPEADKSESQLDVVGSQEPHA